MKKRVFIEATPLVGARMSGVGKVLLESIRALDTPAYSEKYDIILFIPFDERGKLDKYNFTHVKVKLLPWPHKVLSLFSRMRFHPPLDIFLGKGVYLFQNYRNWSLLYSKSITYIHDMAFKVHPEYIEERNYRFLNKYIPLWISRTNRVVTISQSSLREIRGGLGVEDAYVVQNAEEDAMYPRAKAEVRVVRTRYELPDKYFLYLGNIEPRKNLLHTVKGFTRFVVDTKNYDYALVLVGGDGWKNEDVLTEIESARKKGVQIIKPSEYVPDEDLPALITGASAVLQLSWHEGFGLSVLHAFACGVPVVASDIPSLTEVADMTKSGSIIFVDPADDQAIADTIDEITKVKHKTKRPDDILSWDQTISSLAKIIDEL